MKHFQWASPSADPLERYEAFTEHMIAADPGDDPDFDDEWVGCDWCDHRAVMSTPEGWPICQDCADERVRGGW